MENFMEIVPGEPPLHRGS